YGFVVVLSRGFAVEISRTADFVRRGPLSLEVSQIVNRPLGKVQIHTCRKWFAVRDPRWMKRLWCFSAAAELHEPHLNPHLHSASCCAPREQQHPSLALLRTSPQCPLPRGTRGRACGSPVGSDSNSANWPSFHPFQPPKPRSLPPLAHQPCAVENRVNDAAAAQQAADRHPRPHVRANGNRLNRTGKTADRERERGDRTIQAGGYHFLYQCISDWGGWSSRPPLPVLFNSKFPSDSYFVLVLVFKYIIYPLHFKSLGKRAKFPTQLTPHFLSCLVLAILAPVVSANYQQQGVLFWRS
ncbi:hypothetical protein CTAM01_01401, partial [Colletotrichum tamarilloi]